MYNPLVSLRPSIRARSFLGFYVANGFFCLPTFFVKKNSSEDWDFQKHMQGHHFDLHMSFPSLGQDRWIHGTFDGFCFTNCVLPQLGGGNSNVFYFHPYLGKIPILTNIFQLG